MSKWRPIDADLICRRRWEDGCVVYLEDRAQTHHLTPAASAVLTALCNADRALSIEEVLAQGFDAPSTSNTEDAHRASDMPEDDRETLYAILEELERIGAVRSQDS